MTGTTDPKSPLSAELEGLLSRFREGKKLGLARAISVVEDERPGFQVLLHRILDTPRFARRIGFTGPPGAGKSSLVAALTRRFRDGGEEVGIVAVDPTSPYSGGALLGDRIRMNELATDPGIFIRSMATRGSMGGLATTTKEVLDLMDAFGFQRVLVETVGVGQTELEITSAADSVVVILVPESGDAIQAMKAGLMEIADIFVVNKADRPGADALVRDLKLALHLREGEALRDVPAHHGVDLRRLGRPPVLLGKEGQGSQEEQRWEVPVLTTVAQSGDGVEELADAMSRHRDFLDSSGELERRREARAVTRIRDVVEREIRRRVWDSSEVDTAVREAAGRILRGTDTPYSAAGRILSELFPPGTR